MKKKKKNKRKATTNYRTLAWDIQKFQRKKDEVKRFKENCDMHFFVYGIFEVQWSFQLKNVWHRYSWFFYDNIYTEK